MRARLEQVEKQTKKRPKELDDLIEFPKEMVYQWQDFIALHNKRSSNGFGVNPISYQDMHAYFALTKYSPEQWELDLINALDGVFLEIQHKKQEAEKNKKK